MKLNNMREFVKLAEIRNFSKTAEEMYIAQSALSRHIAALEEELRVPLVNRSRTFFELTEEGEAVRDAFSDILERYEDLLRALSRMNSADNGELRLGVLYYDMEFYVSKIRESFRDHYPNIKLILQSYQPEQMESDLLEGKIDAAITYGAEHCPNADLLHLPFLRIPYVVMFDEAHPLSSLSEIGIADLDGKKLLIPQKRLAINSAENDLRQMLLRCGAEIAEYIPISNYDEVPWLLRESGGVYVAPMVNIHAYGEHVSQRFLASELSTDVSVVWRNDRKNPAIESLCNAVKICFP